MTKPPPFTRDGYRYHRGEDDPYWCQVYRQQIASSENLKRSSIFRRKLTSSIVRLSENDRAPQLKIHNDHTVGGDKGYCLIRATHGANRGRFYYEVTVEGMQKSTNSAARVGWGQKYANLQAPLGYDKFGYSYRSRFGTKFHQALGKTYDCSGGYGEGDTIGCLLELPYGNKHNVTEGRHLPTSVKQTTLVCGWKKKDISDKPKILEEHEVPPEKLVELPGSKITFYKNGHCLGVAYENIYEGLYYPSVSLYKDCKLNVNFGPDFRFAPPGIRPASDMAEMEMIDNCLTDLLYMCSLEKLEQEIKG